MFSIDELLSALQNGQSEEEILDNFTEALDCAIHKRAELQLIEEEQKAVEREKARAINEVLENLVDLLNTYYDIDLDYTPEEEAEVIVKEFDQMVNELKPFVKAFARQKEKEKEKEIPSSSNAKVTFTVKPFNKPAITRSAEDNSFDKAIQKLLKEFE